MRQNQIFIEGFQKTLEEFSELREVSLAKGKGNMLKGIILSCSENFESEFLPKFNIIYTNNVDFKRKAEQDQNRFKELQGQIDVTRG